MKKILLAICLMMGLQTLKAQKENNLKNEVPVQVGNKK